MGVTYAYNSIIIGVLIGIWVYAATKSIVLGIIAGIAVTVVGFIIIRAVENALYKAGEQTYDKISEAYQKRKEQKNAESNNHKQ